MNASPTPTSPPEPFVPRLSPWPPRRRRAVRLGALAVVSAMCAVLGGCVGFTEPVAALPGGQVDPAPYIGPWSVEPNTSIVIEPADDGSGMLIGTARDQVHGEADSPGATFTVALSAVNGRVVASVRSDEGYGSDEPWWTILSLELTDDGTRMTIRGLDVDGIEAAVASGDLRGRQVDRDSEGESFGAVVIEAEGSAVLDYLRRSPDAFIGPDETVLVRGDPSAEAHSDVPDAAYLPTAISGPGRGDSTALPALPPGSSGYGGYPGQPGSDRWAQPPTDFGASASSMGLAPGMPTPYMPTPYVPTPSGRTPSFLPDANMPAPVKGIVAALGLLIVLGLAAAMAIDYVRRRNRAGAQVAADSVAAASAAVDGRTIAAARWRPSALATLRRNAWPALLVLVIAVGPLLYLGVLLGTLAFPSWVLLQPGTQAMLHTIAPYVLVFSIGTLIAVAEVATTFPAFAAEALRTKWATVLVAFNALGTTIAYSAVVTYASGHDHPLLRALAIAAGFAVLIRTRFVLARHMGAGGAGAAGADGTSIDLGWPYARIQQLCRQRIDRDLLRDPRYATARLLALFPDTAALRSVAVDSISAHGPAEAAELRARLEAIAGDDIGTGIVRARIARFVVETAAFDHTAFVIEHGGTGDTV